MKLKKIPYSTAREILTLYTSSSFFSSLADDKTTPFELIQKAIAHEYFADAAIFLAHGLAVRESVWWAVMCAETRDDWSQLEHNAIHAARAWVYSPQEIARRFAEKTAEDSGLESGAGWVAQAAFWSGRSITKPKDPVILPPPYLYAQAVAGSINLTAVLPDGKEAVSRYKNYFGIGLDIAHGGNGLISGEYNATSRKSY